MCAATANEAPGSTKEYQERRQLSHHPTPKFAESVNATELWPHVPSPDLRSIGTSSVAPRLAAPLGMISGGDTPVAERWATVGEFDLLEVH
jgi:hypothetical protein